MIFRNLFCSWITTRILYLLKSSNVDINCMMRAMSHFIALANLPDCNKNHDDRVFFNEFQELNLSACSNLIFWFVIVRFICKWHKEMYNNVKIYSSILSKPCVHLEFKTKSIMRIIVVYEWIEMNLLLTDTKRYFMFVINLLT